MQEPRMADGIDAGTNALINQLANPPNPFERLGQSMQGIAALKDFQARRATAGLYGQAIDPTTGQFDTGKFNALSALLALRSWAGCWARFSR
jgi:hypothetical protein